MADRVKGITVQIGGDTTGLSKALKGVNSDIKSTQTTLRDVNRLLKLDPTNTELLAQKQKLLKTEISDTKTKLDSLKQANDQVKDSVRNYDDWKEKYDPIQAEIDETKTKLTDLKSKQEEMKNAGEIDTAEYDKLQAEIDETEAGLKNLQAEAKAVSDEFGNPISPEQYDGLQREIIATEQELKKLEEEAKTANAAIAKIEEAGKSMESVGGKIQDAGKKMTVLSGAVAGVGAAAVKTTADFDAQMSTVQAITGASGEEFEKLKEKAQEMGSKTAFSASEAGEAMEYMAMAGWKTEDMLEGIEGIMNLAAAAGEDLGTTSDIVTDALTAFGLQAKDSGHFADVLATASSNANTNVSMLGESFKYAAPVAGALGYSAEDTAVALGLMANSGIKASQAGTSLRSILNATAGEVKFTGKELGEWTVETQNADGSMRDLNSILEDCRVCFQSMTESEKASNAQALVGKNAMSGFLAIMNASWDDFEGLTAAINDCGGATEEMAQVKLNNLNGQITLLMSALESLMISIGDILMPLISGIVEHIQGVVDWLNGLNDGQKETIVTIAGVIAAIGPLLLIFGTLISTIGKVCTNITTIIGFVGKMQTAFGVITETVLPALQTAFSTVFGFIAANPIVLLIAAVVGLVALIGTQGDKIQSLLNKVNTFLQKVFVKDWTTVFGKTLGEPLNAFFRNLSNIWDSIYEIFTGVIDFIRGVFTGDWERAWRGVKEIFSGIFKGFTAIAKAPLNAVIALINTVIHRFNSVIDMINSVHITNPLTGTTYGFHIGKLRTLAYMAAGGILPDGGQAIVGEAGPEMLTVQGNQAMVQPLTQSNQTNHNTNLGGVSITVYGAPGQDVRELADILMDEMQRATDRKAAVFGG